MGRMALLLAPFKLSRGAVSHAWLACSLLFAAGKVHSANAPLIGPKEFPFEMQFTKGDTRQGSKVRIRVADDSVHYSRTVFEPGKDAVESKLSAPLDIRRKIALRRIMGDLPQYRVFGSCFGKDMRYYLIDTPAGKFYRSMPERSARCFSDEPGIWSLLEDLDTFIAPPDAPTDDPDLS